MGKILINNKSIGDIKNDNVKEIIEYCTKITRLDAESFYLEQNGKRIVDTIDIKSKVHCVLRILGGKGGFGSMLRAIGAQIEKTTNREACRDLSGRRLRDINEEKRLKAWLDKQQDREREAEERKKRKIQKLLAVPKHDFKDEQYEEARSKLTEKVNDAVEEGFKKVHVVEQIGQEQTAGGTDKHGLKRKGVATSTTTIAKKKKSALWIDDISDTGSSSNDSDVSEDESKEKEMAKPKQILPEATTV